MKTINHLLQNLKNQVQQKGLSNVMQAKSLFEEFSGQQWDQYFQNQSEEKDSIVFHQDSHFKLLIIRWDPLKKSKKHGHPRGGGLIKVLAGQLKETRYDIIQTDRALSTHLLKENELTYIHDDIAYHVVENPFDQAAYSLHIYAPGIYQSNVIEDSSDDHSFKLAA